jgi:transposase-like protein
MSVAQGGLSENCPYCLLPREIIAVRFSLFKPCTALFVCPSCGSTSADVDGPSNISERSRHLKAYLLLKWKTSNIVTLAKKRPA